MKMKASGLVVKKKDVWKRGSLLLLLHLLFGRFLYGSDPATVSFSKIGIEEGLSQLSVMAIYQDELGNMWFGTREGVNIYNGSSMRTLHPTGNPSNSLSGNLIRAIHGNSNGSVFIHTQNGIDEFDLKSGAISQRVPMQVNAMNWAYDTLFYANDNAIFAFENGRSHLISKLDEGAEVTALLPLPGHRLAVGTITSGVYEVCSDGKATRVLEPGSRVSSLFEDSRQNLWVSTWENGLFKMRRINEDAKTGNVNEAIDTGNTSSTSYINQGWRIVHYKQNLLEPAKGLSSNFVRAVQEDENGNLWIGTMNGLDKLDEVRSLFYHYDSEVHDNRSLSNQSVWSLYKDKYGNIWVGTYFGGVNYFHPQSTTYTFHNLVKGRFASRPFPIISDIVPYGDHTMLLCTEGDGLIAYNTRDKTYNDVPGLRNVNIKSAYYDEAGNKLYLGLHLGGLRILDLTTQKVKEYPDIRSELDQSNIVRKILPYKGNYLIATYNGLYLFDQESGTFPVFSNRLHQHLTYFVDIAIDNEENLWIASRGLYQHNLNTGETRAFFHDLDNPNTLSNNNVTKLLIDSTGRLWVGTSGGGINLFNRDTFSFTRFTSENSGLQNNYVSNIAESPLGLIFITTTQGLYYLHPGSSEGIHAVSHDDLALNSLFNGGITIKEDGEVYVAGMNGMVSFNEQAIQEDLKPFTLSFTNLWVNNREVSPGDETKLLPSHLPYADKLTFNHKQSNLIFEFASDNIVTRNHYQYRYRVKGISDDWIPIRNGAHEISLMNLDAGTYTLELTGISPRTQTEKAHAQIHFKVKPPFYKSPIAYLLYLVIAIALIGSYLRYERNKIRLESSLRYAKKEKEHLEEVSQLKTRFFTNISHEFRTPLTLISSQVELLKNNEKGQSADSTAITSIAKNVSLMKNLINELLDFRKIDEGKLTIQAGRYNIVPYLHEVYLAFEEYASYKRIDYSFYTSNENIEVWYDRNQLQKVFFNLLSNAFKFTPENGKITFRVTREETCTVVSVKDSGVGISPEYRDKIFDQFYQVAAEGGNDAMTPGTGLGLALSKSIVDVHHATITLESELGQGCQFKVTLLNGSNHFLESEKIALLDPNEASIQKAKDWFPEGDQDESRIKERTNDSGIDHEENDQNRILIVEDNEELLGVLKVVFEPTYNVITATNGNDGLAKTLEHQPHLVLSDLMMPGMSGSEMCMKIKSNFAVCHIPVVLLTAQTAIESTIESLKLGADDYITKPFEIPILLAKCNNLVNGRKRLQERFAASPTLHSNAIASNPMDQEFLEKASRVIEEHMDNPEFGINEFSREMNLGRTSLFNKIKGVTGQTPNDFIITMKMKKATFLLSNHPEFNISDITYQLGFSSPKYFSKCFKKQFGMTPSEYRSIDSTI